jgi:hypothetical protein
MIHRSRGVPLIVQAERGYDNTIVLENLRMAISDMRRISVLHLCFPADDLQPLLQELSDAAPMLESLRLTTTNKSMYRNPDPNSQLSQPIEVPDTLFSGHAPSLRLLELSCCKFSWQSLPLLNLTHLELRNTATPPSFSQMLKFLREVPMLNTLILEEALATQPLHHVTPDIIPPRQVLPNLCVLTLKGSAETCTGLLQHITYPITAIATFRFEVPSEENPIFNRFLREAQSAVIYGSGEEMIQSLFISETNGPELTLQCFYGRRSFVPHIFTDDPPQLTVIVRQKSPSQWHRSIAGMVLSSAISFPLAEAQILHVMRVDLSGPDWARSLKCLPKIHTIRLRGMFPTRLMRALADNEAAPATLILPQLRSLWLTGVEFGFVQQHGQESRESFATCL